MKKTAIVLFICCMLMLVACASGESGSAAPEMPVFSQQFAGYPLRLHQLANDSERAYSHAGPGKNYMESGGYKPYKQQEIIAYFIENDWVYCYIDYATAEDRLVYFPKYSFETIDTNLPYFDSLESFEGETTGDTIASWGPSHEFNLLTSSPVAGGTPIAAFFQENGYIFAEYKSNGQLTRMWLPADKVSIPNVAFAITAEPHYQNGRSGWGYADDKKDDNAESTDESTDVVPTPANEPDNSQPDVPVDQNNSPETPQTQPVPDNNQNNNSNPGTTQTNSQNESDDDDESWSEWR